VSSNTVGGVSRGKSQSPSFDKLWAKVGGAGIEIDLALQQESKKASYNRHRKRLHTASSPWMAEYKDQSNAEPPDTRSTKRRKITMERQGGNSEGELEDLRAAHLKDIRAKERQTQDWHPMTQE